MRKPRARLAQPGSLALGQVDGVAEVRARPEQAVFLVDAEVVGRSGVQRP